MRYEEEKMIAWYWVVIAFVGGLVAGLFIFNSCSNNKIAELEEWIEILEQR